MGEEAEVGEELEVGEEVEEAELEVGERAGGGGK